jgi:hypothetical protein
MAKEIPFERRTMLFIERGRPANLRRPSYGAAWYRRFWNAVGAKSWMQVSSPLYISVKSRSKDKIDPLNSDNPLFPM